MLQIRLSNKGSPSEAGGGKLPSGESVTVACPDHLVLADLPVAKGIGSAAGASRVKIVGHKSRQQIGKRVHFCVRCDFPIAIYGRLDPCSHVFCLDCARRDPICSLCDARILRIQTIKMMEGIFICGVSDCLKSFLSKDEFKDHVSAVHSDMLNQNQGTETEDLSSKKPAALDSTVQAPAKPDFNSQANNQEDGAHRLPPGDQVTPSLPVMQPKPVAPFFGQFPVQPSESQIVNNRDHGFDMQHMNRFPPQGFDTSEAVLQQGILSERPQDHNVNSVQHLGFDVPFNQNVMLASSPFEVPSFAPDGTKLGTEEGSLRRFSSGLAGAVNVNLQGSRSGPWNVAPNRVALDNSLMVSRGGSDQNVMLASSPSGVSSFAPDGTKLGTEQGSLRHFSSGLAGAVNVNLQRSHSGPWNVAPIRVALDNSMMVSHGGSDDTRNMLDPQGRAGISQGVSNLPHPSLFNRGVEQVQGGSAADSMGGNGLLAPPPPPSSQMSHMQSNSFPGGIAHRRRG